jgi:hypothetical protein
MKQNGNMNVIISFSKWKLDRDAVDINLLTTFDEAAKHRIVPSTANDETVRKVCSLLPMHIISTGSRKARRSVFGNEETRIKVNIGTIESLLPSDIARGVDLRTLYTLMPSNWVIKETEVVIERRSCPDPYRRPQNNLVEAVLKSTKARCALIRSDSIAGCAFSWYVLMC